MSDHPGTVPLTDDDIVRLALYEYADKVASSVLNARVRDLAGAILNGGKTLADCDPVIRTCCFKCHQEDVNGLPVERRLFGNLPFVYAPCECGNKRCPKSTWHENECTGSNETGQPGSAWEHAR